MPSSLPPELLEQHLRELKLLDQWASANAPTTSGNSTPSSHDPFSPETIPVPPRPAVADKPEQDTVTLSDGRPLAPVASVEILPIAPQPPQRDAVPEDLDDETAEQTPANSAIQDDANEPSQDNEDAGSSCAQHREDGFVAALGLCNAPGCVCDWVERFVAWLGQFCPCSTPHARGSLPASCAVLPQSEASEPGHCNGCGGGARYVQCTEAARTIADSATQRAESCSRSCPRQAPVLVRKVYPVADLIGSHDEGTTLCQLVTDFVACNTWLCEPQSSGVELEVAPHCRAAACQAPRPQEKVRGRIAYFPGAACLVVLHVPEVQREVAEFLGELRRAAQLQELELRPAAGGMDSGPGKEPPNVLVIPVVRHVFVPVAVPVPVGVPDHKLPPPEQFRIPPASPDDEDFPASPARRFAPPATPEKLPNCQPPEPGPGFPWHRFWDSWRGGMPALPLRPEFLPQHPKAPRTLPNTPPCPAPNDSASPPAETEDCPDLEDFHPLETDLHPPIG
ncbi:hypothetical protein HRbin36_01860 [bacterium HR36]|nr:hypothetical protein HRbin36_01860 [bacterium HR36]